MRKLEVKRTCQPKNKKIERLMRSTRRIDNQYKAGVISHCVITGIFKRRSEHLWALLGVRRWWFFLTDWLTDLDECKCNIYRADLGAVSKCKCTSDRWVAKTCVQGMESFHLQLKLSWSCFIQFLHFTTLPFPLPLTPSLSHSLTLTHPSPHPPTHPVILSLTL